MTAINDVLNQAIAAGKVPGLVAMAANRDGVFFEAAAGTRGVDNDRAMRIDSMHRIFSMTKAIGTLAAVKLIEDGKLALDTPVADILPDFAKLRVLEGFDGDTPKLRAPRTQATIRHLATHTSGLEYEFWNANTSKYLQVTGHPTVLSGLKKSLNYPLSFDPGTDWGYGISIDWLGQVVEKVSGQCIDAYCKKFLFDPLGMKDTVFECKGAHRDRLVTAHTHDESGALVPTGLEAPAEPEFYGMGHALFSTAPDYMRFLRMLLGGGELDGVRIVKPETVDLICQNHIGELTMGKMISTSPPLSADVDFFPGVDKKWGLGFMFNEEDIPGMRAAGSQSWAGVLNSHYWWDPKTGIIGIIFMQHLPFADETALQIYGDFERAVYASL
ncbi:MAG: beta-lactamase family protein [Fimbriimonadaceae bacterium]|nr:beta-lactamase family protein [Alphaproteobacteria bacterium]